MIAVMDMKVLFVTEKVEYGLLAEEIIASSLFVLFAVSIDCTNNMCENGAHCKVLAGDYICKCLPEYIGAFCENKGMYYLEFVCTS